MVDQHTEVSGFFNEISSDYKTKYTGEDAFHKYFFHERLDEAVSRFDFSGKKVLDIGAGTGDLYDRIREFEPDYYACDIAGEMLKSSHIPEGRRFEGRCYEIDFPEERFELVFMLGVSTYLVREELEKTARFVHSKLEPGGSFVVTFTNSASIDWKMRKILKRLARVFSREGKVLAQGFQIFPHDRSGARDIVGDDFEERNTIWLNHTVFPFYFLSKKIFVEFAKWIHRSVKSDWALERLSSDFMLVLQKRS